MAFTVVYDACVLYPAPLRDLLIRIANTGIVRARWTDRLLDECFDSIAAQRPDLKSDALARTRRLMGEAVRGSGHRHLQLDGLPSRSAAQTLTAKRPLIERAPSSVLRLLPSTATAGERGLGATRGGPSQSTGRRS